MRLLVEEIHYRADIRHKKYKACRPVIGGYLDKLIVVLAHMHPLIPSSYHWRLLVVAEV